MSMAAPEHVQVLSNKVIGVEQHGIEVDADGAGEYLVRGNLALRNKLVGIHFGPDTRKNRIAGNTALGNVVFDCQDESRRHGTAEPGNTWRDNVGPKASPVGICGLHHDKPKKHKRHRHKQRKHHKKKRCECSFPRRL
jgi:parallel beta-helix repeat protein